MTQTTRRPQDQAVIDLIRDLLQPQQVPTYTSVDDPPAIYLAKRYLTMLGLPALTCLLLYLMVVNAAKADGESGIIYFISSGLIWLLITLWYSGQRMEKQTELIKAEQQAENVRFAREMHKLREEQRVQLTDKLSSMDVARATVSGQFSAQELQHLWRSREMDEDIREKDKQREHERQTQKTKNRHEFKMMRERVKKELEIFKSRLNIENPSEVDKMREKREAFELERITWEAIEAMPEDTEAQRDAKYRRMEAFDRRLINK